MWVLSDALDKAKFALGNALDLPCFDLSFSI